jgi:hypothetical protein
MMTNTTARPRSALLCVFLSFLCVALPGRVQAGSPPAAPAPQTGAAQAPEPQPPAPTPQPATPPQARQPVYFEPTYLNLLRAMIRFKGYDLGNDELVDAYTLIEGCDLYTKFYKNDFAWKQVRAMYRKSLTQKMDLLPEYFSFVSPLLLDRYDFQSGIFRFNGNSVMRNAHRLVLADHPISTCATSWDSLSRLPRQISVDISPFTIEGLKISPDQAESLITDMERDKSKERVVYARFHVHITSAPVLPISDDPTKSSHYNFQGNLETISFFEDRNLQHPLWVYRPVYESEEQRAREMNDILNLKSPAIEEGIESPQPPLP